MSPVTISYSRGLRRSARLPQRSASAPGLRPALADLEGVVDPEGRANVLPPQATEMPPLVVPQSVGIWEGTDYSEESLPQDFNVYQGDEARELPD